MRDGDMVEVMEGAGRVWGARRKQRERWGHLRQSFVGPGSS